MADLQVRTDRSQWFCYSVLLWVHFNIECSNAIYQSSSICSMGGLDYSSSPGVTFAIGLRATWHGFSTCLTFLACRSQIQDETSVRKPQSIHIRTERSHLPHNPWIWAATKVWSGAASHCCWHPSFSVVFLYTSHSHHHLKLTLYIVLVVVMRPKDV